jgi:hypothetical protein
MDVGVGVGSSETAVPKLADPKPVAGVLQPVDDVRVLRVGHGEKHVDPRFGAQPRY